MGTVVITLKFNQEDGTRMQVAFGDFMNLGEPATSQQIEAHVIAHLNRVVDMIDGSFDVQGSIDGEPGARHLLPHPLDRSRRIKPE